MSPRHVLTALLALFFFTPAQPSHAAAFVRGAYYRLGDDDPGAAPNLSGQDPTRDSFAEALHLSRIEDPRYSADVPPLGPTPNTLSMRFASLEGVVVPGYYGRNQSLDMASGGFALEAWVKRRSVPDGVGGIPVPSVQQVIAYNGIPSDGAGRTANGFGLFYKDGDFVARIGGLADVTLGPGDPDVWHHLAYVHSLGTSSYYFDGKLVRESSTDPAPRPASGGFWVGGNAHPLIDPGEHLFHGWIDEVRYQMFNPLAAGSFNPTDFLIVPEPGAGMLLLIAASFAFGRRRKGA